MTKLTLEEYLDIFKENGIAIQITLDVNHNSTVHAIPKDERYAGLQRTEHETLIGALELMKERLIDPYVGKELKVMDRVGILNADGNQIAKGTIININEFREPSMMYAIDVDNYKEDVVFCGESQLVKID